MKLFWDKLIHEGYFIAIGDISAIYALSVILGISVTCDFLLVVFLIIFSLISFNYYKEINQDMLTNLDRAQITKKRKKILPFVIILGVTMALGLVYYFSSILTVVFLLCLLVAGLLYTTTLKAVTKNVLGLKSFYVAFFYSLLLVLLILYYKSPFSLATFLVLSFYFSRIFINTVFCDIRDIKGDQKDGLKTFAIVWGENKTVYVLSCLNILTILPILFGVLWGLLPVFSLLILVTVLYTLFNLIAYKKRIVHSSTLFNILVEGEFIYWLPLILIGKYII